jgi:predicted nucleic acid-binding protein
LTRDRLLDAVCRISNWPGIEIVHIGEESHTQAITLLRGRQDKGWSLVDATSFIVMEHRKIREALAHDRHFGQATFTQLL